MELSSVLYATTGSYSAVLQDKNGILKQTAAGQRRIAGRGRQSYGAKLCAKLPPGMANKEFKQGQPMHIKLTGGRVEEATTQGVPPAQYSRTMVCLSAPS